MANFLTFIRRQGIVGLAIGFILGGAVNGVVNSLVKDILQPTLSLMVSTESVLLLQYKGILYGKFFIALIDFLVLAGVVYFIFKRLSLDKLDLPKEEKK